MKKIISILIACFMLAITASASSVKIDAKANTATVNQTHVLLPPMLPTGHKINCTVPDNVSALTQISRIKKEATGWNQVAIKVDANTMFSEDAKGTTGWTKLCRTLASTNSDTKGTHFTMANKMQSGVSIDIGSMMANTNNTVGVVIRI